MTRLIDLAVALENDVPADPPYMKPKITYRNHSDTLGNLANDFPTLDPSRMPDGAYCAVERIDLSTHNGTHLDAPWHHHPTMDGGKRAITIDEVPLEWCYGPGVKLDFRNVPNGHVVRAAEVEAELERIGHDLKPGDIVLVNTAAAAAYGTEAYLDTGCGMGREATKYLVDRGVRLTGIDAWGWDAPFSSIAKRFEETDDVGLIWEGHKVSRETGYCHMEKLTNLDQLPGTGFTVACFPIKIRGASAGWVRPVAIIDG